MQTCLTTELHALLFSKKFDKAVADFDKTIRLKPKYSFAFLGRGLARNGQGEYAKALADYDQAQKLDPDYPAPYKYRALLRATCPDEKIRDGRLAVQDANQGCEKTRFRDATYLDALAAAYAEAGDFEKAALWQSRALQQNPGDKMAEYQERLALYRDGKPYRAE